MAVLGGTSVTYVYRRGSPTTPSWTRTQTLNAPSNSLAMVADGTVLAIGRAGSIRLHRMNASDVYEEAPFAILTPPTPAPNMASIDMVLHEHAPVPGERECFIATPFTPGFAVFRSTPGTRCTGTWELQAFQWTFSSSPRHVDIQASEEGGPPDVLVSGYVDGMRSFYFNGTAWNEDAVTPIPGQFFVGLGVGGLDVVVAGGLTSIQVRALRRAAIGSPWVEMGELGCTPTVPGVTITHCGRMGGISRSTNTIVITGGPVQIGLSRSSWVFQRPSPAHNWTEVGRNVSTISLGYPAADAHRHAVLDWYAVLADGVRFSEPSVFALITAECPTMAPTEARRRT